ncbi:hypothetical protein [Aquipseudomonas ullengensis]|uniref:DUF2188 domain-containing protein n=1 Tax=Aquipseudomonas ullengensis TaxID=2759166 RepID=A0A7W4LQQ9_9GAMM|nr:hypothetical protein [Pseudomonas ullengensis]MBB2497465.1 hypothetical protein [Pseudomonas ullengensis]
MKIIVRTVMTPQGSRWQVCLDRHGVTFRSEAEAKQFVRTLENRLQAPHALPRQPESVAS